MLRWWLNRMSYGKHGEWHNKPLMPPSVSPFTDVSVTVSCLCPLQGPFGSSDKFWCDSPPTCPSHRFHPLSRVYCAYQEEMSESICKFHTFTAIIIGFICCCTATGNICSTLFDTVKPGFQVFTLLPKHLISVVINLHSWQCISGLFVVLALQNDIKPTVKSQELLITGHKSKRGWCTASFIYRKMSDLSNEEKWSLSQSLLSCDPKVMATVYKVM